jgi:hypothetical protein
MPPFRNEAVIEVVILFEAVEVIRRVRVDHRGHPANNADADIVIRCDHRSGVWKLFVVPNEIVDPCRPSRVDIDRSDLRCERVGKEKLFFTKYSRECRE